MLGLPKSTEIKKQLPKTAIYAKFHMNTAEKAKIDSDIARITIVNEITASKINVAEGQEIKSFYILQVILKKKDYNEKNILTISKLIPQNIIFALEYDEKIRLASCIDSYLLQGEWKNAEDVSLSLNGLNMDAVWKDIIKNIEQGDWNDKLSVKENIDRRIKINKLNKEIAKLEKQARAERQPKKKFELVQRINEFKKELLNV